MSPLRVSGALAFQKLVQKIPPREAKGLQAYQAHWWLSCIPTFSPLTVTVSSPSFYRLKI